jgi:DNA sulfur modification protein DndD
MAGYFINDGEGDDLTSDDNGMISISRSIEDILGFGMAKRALDDVIQIRKEFFGKWKALNKEGDLSSEIRQVEFLQNDLQNVQKTLSSDQEVLVKYEFQLSEINSAMGNSDIPTIKAKQQKRASQEKALSTARSNLKSLRAKKKTLIKEYATASFSAHIKISDLDFLEKESLKGKFPGDFNLQLVMDIMARKECLCGTEICEGTEQYDSIKSLQFSAADGGTLDRLQNARAKINKIDTLSGQINKRIKENFTQYQASERAIDRIKKTLEELSLEIDDSGFDAIQALEKNRKLYVAKINSTNQAIGRSQQRILDLEVEISDINAKLKTANNVSPMVKQLDRKMELCDEVITNIKQKLVATREGVLVKLQMKIDEFLDTYLQQDYSVKITEDRKIGLVDRRGNFIAPSKGQAAILKFIYISTLVSIARENRDVDTNIFTAGAIAPLMFDAPFSDLQPTYAINVANTLPGLVDQLVIIMYQDASKPIDEILKGNNQLGKVFCFNQDIEGPLKENSATTITVDGVTKTIVSYEQKRDRVRIEEVISYV